MYALIADKIKLFAIYVRKKLHSSEILRLKRKRNLHKAPRNQKRKIFKGRMIMRIVNKNLQYKNWMMILMMIEVEKTVLFW